MGADGSGGGDTEGVAAALHPGPAPSASDDGGGGSDLRPREASPYLADQEAPLRPAAVPPLSVRVGTPSPRTAAAAAASSDRHAPQRPRSAAINPHHHPPAGAKGGSSSVASALGPTYADCRNALIALEAQLKDERTRIEFAFAPLVPRGSRSGGGGTGVGGGAAAVPLIRGERLMWLQWIITAGGAGWAFFEADGAGTAPSGGGGGRASGGGGGGARTAIATQHASLADFLTQVEERYVGFVELLRVSHAQSALWSRAGCLHTGPGSVPAGVRP